MKSLLIKDTTTEERIEIVKTFLSSGSSDCEGIDMDDLYYDYIFGLKELADINREFSEKHAGSVRADNQNRPLESVSPITLRHNFPSIFMQNRLYTSVNAMYSRF